MDLTPQQFEELEELNRQPVKDDDVLGYVEFIETALKVRTHERDALIEENTRIRNKGGFTEELRKLIKDKEWVTDGRECLTYCLWCSSLWHKGHTSECPMFGSDGYVDPEVRDKE